MVTPKMYPHNSPDRAARRAVMRATTVPDPGVRTAMTSTEATMESARFGRVLAVQREEQLLERRLPTEQLRHRRRTQRGHQWLHRPSHLQPDNGPIGLE